MSRLVTFNALWILSERDASARHLTFHPQRNLLAGDNGTGKSRVLKHLVWALGCEPPKRAGPGFDSNAVAAVDVSIGSKRCTFLRQNRRRAAFNEQGVLEFVTDSASEWAAYFAEVFDFPLKLQRPEDAGFAFAGPGYAMLPFYIDQDGGWGLKWNAFTDLTQFTKWQTPVFTSFTGVKPERYVREQLRKDEATYRLRQAKAQASVQEAAYKEVLAMLPEGTAVIDEKLFAEQLRDIAEKVQGLQAQQDQARAELITLAQQRQSRYSELQMALENEKELVEDLAYLSDFKDEAQLVCPTCSQVHMTSFGARQTLAVDAHDLHEVAVKLQGELDKVSAKEAALQQRLTAIGLKLRELKASMQLEDQGHKVADVIAAKSRDTLKLAYDATRRDLTSTIDSLVEEKKEVDEQLAALTDKGREKRVKTYFGELLISYADKLNIDRAEISTKLAIGARPPGASGSYAPRAVLATHLALIGTHLHTGPGFTFPFIVDTPQQSGQDSTSLSQMLDTILEPAVLGQRLVASESIPAGWIPPENCKVLTFNEKRHLLREVEYRDGIEALGGMVTTMKAALIASEEPSVEGEVPVASSNADEDDS